jgi:hypothetical protein
MTDDKRPQEYLREPLVAGETVGVRFDAGERDALRRAARWLCNWVGEEPFIDDATARYEEGVKGVLAALARPTPEEPT